jgi:hypothetical protein
VSVSTVQASIHPFGSAGTFRHCRASVSLLARDDILTACARGAQMAIDVAKMTDNRRPELELIAERNEKIFLLAFPPKFPAISDTVASVASRLLVTHILRLRQYY